MTSSTTPEAGTVTYTFDGNHQLLTRTDAKSQQRQHFAGAALPAPWGTNNNNTGTAFNNYGSNYAKSTDEAGVSRTSYVDGLGRLTQVTENGLSLPSGASPPPCSTTSGGLATTCYYYDVLDNLISVTPPNGCGVTAPYTCNGRTFTYTSLQRLQTTVNPESGTTSYTYDPNGNLLTRTAGGITTTYTYDELDELTAKTYSDYNSASPTPWASYTYNKGWRTSAFAGNTTYAYTTFDGLGRATAATQTTSGTPYAFTYVYNLLDEIRLMTMPSGTVVTTGYDLTGSPNAVSGQASSAPTATNYAWVLSKTPAGAIQQLTLGNGLTEQTCYNDHQQPFVIRQRNASATSCQTGTAADGYDVGYFSYTFPAGNNGNVSGQNFNTARTARLEPRVFSRPIRTIWRTGCRA
jgi:YD repeat-containing protein